MDFKANLIFNHGKPLSAYTTESDGFAYPKTLDMRDLVLQTENQGMTSMCAAYTATSWLESLMWRKTGKGLIHVKVRMRHCVSFILWSKTNTVRTGEKKCNK